jgi:hypothetical protein
MHLHSSVIGHHPHDLVCHSRTLRQYRTWSLVTRGHRPGQVFTCRYISVTYGDFPCHRQSPDVTEDPLAISGHITDHFHWSSVTSRMTCHHFWHFSENRKNFPYGHRVPHDGHRYSAVELSAPFVLLLHVRSRVRSLELRVIGCQPITTHSFA